jgi:hypothetical protein
MVDFLNEIFDEFDIGEKDKVTTALNIAEYEVASGGDTKVGNRTSKVCLNCVSKIMRDADIPMPRTSSIDNFMEAMAGIKTSLYEYDANSMQYVQSSPKLWQDRDKFDIIDKPGGIKAGDIMIVESHNGNYHGKHAVLVSNVQGSVDNSGFWGGMFSGIDVIHDMGSNYPISKTHYEWTELVEGEDHPESAGNRKFIAAYRYRGK